MASWLLTGLPTLSERAKTVTPPSDFKFVCPHCGQHIACENRCRGLAVECPGCGARIRVPRGTGAPGPTQQGMLVPQASDFRFACPHCGQHIACEERCCGLPIDCPACHARIKVPSKPISPAAPAPLPLPAPDRRAPPAQPQSPPLPGVGPLPCRRPASSERGLEIEVVQRLSTWFTLWWVSLLAVVGLPLIFIGVNGMPNTLGLSGGEAILLVWFPCMIAAVVLYCLILYTLWTFIPVDTARTTPAKAVGLLFVPLFNFYWNFVAFHGLAESLNAQLKRNSILNRRVNEGLSVSYCVLMCCSIVPVAGVPAALVGLGIWIVAVKQMKDAGIVLLHQGSTKLA